MKTQHFTHQAMCDELEVRYDLSCPGVDFSVPVNQSDFEKSVNTFLADYQAATAEIDRLTDHTDGVDYALAVSSGIIAGLIDSFFVGEWDFAKAKARSNEEINKKIEAFAREKGWTGKGLKEAVAWLEEKYPLPGDSTWNGENIHVSAKSHHLDDIAHHPTLIGLLFCIISQFTEKAMYSNRYGEFYAIPIAVDENGQLDGKTPAAKVSAGIINWCINVARNWEGHLYSDMAGSKQTAGKGMGIPGSILSTLKELSMLPFLKDTEFPKKLYQAYTKGIGTEKGQLDLKAFNVLFQGGDSNKFDLRTENAVKNELKRQSIPVIINEVVVRSFYFVRHLSLEWKEKGDLQLLEWKNVLPINNRTIIRMLTISTGTFTVVDMADAAIRSAVKSKGLPHTFAANFVLRVNFVGVGRFAISCSSELMMSMRKGRMELAVSTGAVANTALTANQAIADIQEIEGNRQKRHNELEKSTKRLSSLKF